MSAGGRKGIAVFVRTNARRTRGESSDAAETPASAGINSTGVRRGRSDGSYQLSLTCLSVYSTPGILAT